MYAPEDTQVQHAGSNGELMGCMQREIKTLFDYENAPYSNMVLGEVLNYPGKWSSYPPHHHPQPEVYFYRFDYPDGFGASFADGEVYTSHHNGLTVINHGFHSQCAAPGYAMCYVWGIRHLKDDPWQKTRIDDKEHADLRALRPRVDIESQLRERRLRFLVHRGIIKQSRLVLDASSDKHVIRDGKKLYNIEFLVNAGDSGVAGILRRLEMSLFPIDPDLSFFRHDLYGRERFRSRE